MTSLADNRKETVRPAKGRAIMYHRDSSGRHETTAVQYVLWAVKQAAERELRFDGTAEAIQSMIISGGSVRGDLFLDWDVPGNLSQRPALDAMIAKIKTDKSISHLFVAHRDRLFRPDAAMDGVQLETLIRKMGIEIVFINSVATALKRGDRMEDGDLILTAIEYQAAGKYRRDLARKSLLSSIERARHGYSTGGRAKYGFERWLVGADNEEIRALRDGESVRQQGCHVVWRPKKDGTYETRCKIKKDLSTLTASAIARQLNKEGAPPPDSGRIRTDRGVRHLTRKIWYATTITNIGRDPIDAGVVSYGRRSMGDQLRLSAEGPRTLEDQDCNVDGVPKVVQNSPEIVIRARGHFPSSTSEQEQAKLDAVLDKRAGTQRGKPRSRSPEKNPLGGRVFDLHCGWPMYRVPYRDSFRYTCGNYQQSHGQQCGHNHVDGPAAARLVLSFMRQRLMHSDNFNKLRGKLLELARRENESCKARTVVSDLQEQKRLISDKLSLAGENLALANTHHQRLQLGKAIDKWAAEEARLETELDRATQESRPMIDLEQEVDAACQQLDDLRTFVADSEDFGKIGRLFDTIDARLFISFKDENWGKRKVRHPSRGILVLGEAPNPI